MVVPDGVERIGNCWFWGSGIESVAIPVSVREIGTEAFCRCERLRSVSFAANSQLEKIGKRAFCWSGLERIAIPSSVTKLSEMAFYGCSSLTAVSFEKESRLK